MAPKMEIGIRVGSFNRNLVLYETTAPKEFDGMGTCEYYADGSGTRYVLIEDENLSWQITRYRSGHHECVASDAVCPLTLEKFFLGRLFPTLKG
jgi:hypothetical protein